MAGPCALVACDRTTQGAAEPIAMRPWEPPRHIHTIPAPPSCDARDPVVQVTSTRSEDGSVTFTVDGREHRATVGPVLRIESATVVHQEEAPNRLSAILAPAPGELWAFVSVDLGCGGEEMPIRARWRVGLTEQGPPVPQRLPH